MTCTPVVTAYGGRGASALCTQPHTLPFTGLALGAYVVLGLCLIVLGVFLRRNGRDA